VFFLLVLITFSSSSIYTLGASALEPTETEEECADKNSIRIRRNKKMQNICAWVQGNLAKRCSMKVKKKFKKRNKFGVKVKKVRRYSCAKQCACSCAPYVEDEGGGDNNNDTNEDEKLCPVGLVTEISGGAAEGGAVDRGISMSSYAVSEGSCIEDGYEQNRQCSYGWVWTGCTYDELKCEPKRTCTCAMAYVAKDEEWVCDLVQYPSCEPDPGGGRSTSTVPPEKGKDCLPGDPIPKPRPGSVAPTAAADDEAEQVLGIRRMLRD